MGIQILHTRMVGVFWGAFDPPTRAHIAIIKAALSLSCISHLIVVINNHSYKEYTFPLAQRRELLIEEIGPGLLDKITILVQDDAQPADFSHLISISSLPLCAIAGSDAYIRWHSYSTSSERNLYTAIAVVPRGDQKTTLLDENAFLLPIDPILKDVSSTQQKQNSRFEK